ncbi:MAG: hypothetical protein QXN51_05665, partial [Ignisphaera sp.]
GDEKISELVIQWGRYGSSLRGFYRVLESLNIMSTDYIHNGWREPPWYEIIDMGLPFNYFKMRYQYLIS